MRIGLLFILFVFIIINEYFCRVIFMKQKVIFILLNDYTDWEGAFLSTALHVGVVPGK